MHFWNDSGFVLGIDQSITFFRLVPKLERCSKHANFAANV